MILYRSIVQVLLGYRKEVEVDQNDYVPEDLVNIYDIDPSTGRNYTPVQPESPVALGVGYVSV